MQCPHKCYDVVTIEIMITIHNDTAVFVGQTNNVELAFTNSGNWILTHALSVSSGTNDAIELPYLRDGSVVTVDANGFVNVSQGPDLITYTVEGFGYGVASLGIAIVIMWAWVRLMRIGMRPGPGEVVE